MHNFIDASLDNIIQIKQIKHFLYINSSTLADDNNALDFWQLVYVTDGILTEYSNDRETELTKNCVLFHKPGEFSRSRNHHPQNRPKAYFISFVCNSPTMEFLAGYCGKLSEASIEIMTKLIEEAKNTFNIINTETVSMVKRLPDAPLGGFQMFKIYMESLIINILREEIQKNSKQIFVSKNEFDNHIHQSVIDYLTANIYEDINLDNICSALNYSKTFLCSKFKDIEGMSIMSYMNMLKITEACKLIKSDKYSMSKIANILKFNNPYYFSRVFKRIKGITPMEYKKIGRNSD